MKSLSILIVVALLLVTPGIGFCETNGLALGVEKITKAPFDMMKGANSHLFTPVKEINHGALDLTDHARAAVVSVGLNFGQPVEG